MVPHGSSNTETHKLRSKLWLDTSGKNRRSTSIVIRPLRVSNVILAIDLKSVSVLFKTLIISGNGGIIGTLGCVLVSLRSIGSKDRWYRRSRSLRNSGARRTRDLAGEHTPKTKTTHVDAHKGSEVK